MKKFNLFLSLMVALVLTGYSQFRVETVPPLNGGNGSGGSCFQLTVKSPIVLDSLRQAFQAGTSTPEIWYSATDTVGPPNITVANGWTLAATSPALTGLSAGLTPTLQTIPVGLGLVLTPGVYRFYIGASTGTNVVYTTWNAANQDVWDNAFITIKTGTNYGYGGAVPNPNFHPRQWNGGIVYSPLGGANDASVLSVDSPTVYCAGTHSVIATIGNYGVNQIDSVNINWEINGVAQAQVQYIGLIDTLFGANPNQVKVNLGTATFAAGSTDIKVYTSDPNGVADTTNLNDTLLLTVTSAAAPTAVATLNATLTSIDVDVTGAIGTIDYEYGPIGFALGTGTTGSSATSMFTISGLTQGTTYDVYVRSNCGSNDTSAYVGPETFNTSYGLPFSQDFENFPGGLNNNPFPEGWSSSSTAAFQVPSWRSYLVNGNFGPGFNTGPIVDNTTGLAGSIFMYMETSGGANDSTDLNTPPVFVDPTVGTIELGYYHYNFGPAVERLEVILDTNGVETILATHAGQIQGTANDPWSFNSVRVNNVQGQSVTIKFRGFNSAGFAGGDIALDDVTIDPILPLNAGVLNIQSPTGSLCPGTITPVVGVKNYGSTTIDSVYVKWNVNGALDSVKYVGTILSGDTASVTLGSLSINASTIYDIDIYTDNPNNATDQFNADDSLIIRGLRTGLSGVFTLNSTLPSSATNISSFSELETIINNYGLCGPTTVNVAAGTYIDVLAFDNPPGMSSVNTLTIDGADSALVTLENDQSNSDVILGFAGASNITVKNMTIRSTRTSGGNYSVIHFGDASNHDSIVNVNVIMDNTVTFGAVCLLASQAPTNTFGQGDNANYLTVMNSSFEGGDNSVRLIGNGGPFGNGWTVGNKVINCTSSDADDIGFYFDDQDSVEIWNSTVTDLRTTSTFTGYGIEMFDGMNFIISGNYLDVPYTGIYVTNANSGMPASRAGEISNNMISCINNSGLWTTNSFWVNYWNNSVYCAGTSTFDAGIYLDDGFGTLNMDSLDFRNNVVHTTTIPAFRVDEPDSIFSKFDNNVFSSAGTNLLDIDGTIYTDLASYQTAQPNFNAASLHGDPQYASATDLHIVGTFINNMGDNSVPLTVDIDGDTRPIAGSTVMDPGADEFDPPACPPPVNLRGVNLTANTIDIVWDGVAGNYDYEVVLGGSTPGSGTAVVTTVDSVLITGLNASTSYDVNVREICGRADTSLYLTYSFTTPIQGPSGVNCITGASSFLYTEEFNAQGGWTGNFGTGGTTRMWNINSGGTGSGGTGPSGAHSGNNYLYYEASFGTPTVASIVSPAYDLTSASDSAELSFWMHAFGPDQGLFEVGIAKSAAGPFSTVFTNALELQTSNAAAYQQVGIRIDSMVGDTLYIEFKMTHNAGGGFQGDLAIDLLEINSCISCAAPNALVDSNLTSNSVDLAWNQNGTALSWEVEYGLTGFTLGNGTRTAVTTLPVSLTGLSTITGYDWYVRAICAPGDTSIWAAGQFTTPCAPFNAPYYTGFEGMTTNQNADCWDDFITPYTTFANVWVRDFTGVNGPYAGTQALYIYPQFGYNQLSDTCAAISPNFPDMTSGTKRVRFWSSVDDAANQALIVGTVNNPGPGGVYTILDTLTYAVNDVYQNFTVDITTANGYNGTDEFLFFAHNLDPLATFDYIRIDEFRYEDIPSCVRPSNLLESNPTLTTVDLDWTENNAATTWEISYGAPGFTVGSGTQQVVTAKPFTLTGLTASTTYEYYVRSICAVGDTSFWEGSLQFSTANAVPYFQDFELFGRNAGPVTTAGWSNTSAVNPKWESGSNTGSGGTGPVADHTTGTGTFMFLEASAPAAVGDMDTLFTPSMIVPATAGPLTMSFWYHMHGADMGSLEVYIDSMGTLIALDTLVGELHPNQTDPWLFDSIPLNGAYNGTSISFVFVGVRGIGFTSDMAIDDFSVDFTVGLDDVTSPALRGLSISPNPSNGLFTLNMNTPQRENFNMTVRDVNGKVVYTENLNVNGAYRNDLDFTSFAKGVYFMQIQSDTDSRVEKLIIQ